MIKKLHFLLFLLSASLFSQPYPDQFITHEKENLVNKIESSSGIQISQDGKKIALSEGYTFGSILFQPDSSAHPFNRGLPSWNGNVEGDNAGFKVLMRFYKNGWSPWLTVGFWKNNVWGTYGSTSYSGGRIDIDYAVLYSYHSKWQFQVVMKRNSSSEPSPSLHKLSFFISDETTTQNVNIPSIVSDNPAAIFINTQHFYQYGLDPGIGGNICSPTSASMVLRSYNIPVDPLQFARDNYDPYWGIFGVWPRTVQNTSEYNLNGAVTRYRTWSDTREVLANNGRIVMSVGPPLYEGHLMMLAGFDAQGNPLVHDPAKSNGYNYKFNKTSLSQSWFNKGGISYTFYPESVTSVKDEITIINDYSIDVFPNPFNPLTNIRVEIPQKSFIEVDVYNVNGEKAGSLFKGEANEGIMNLKWNASDLPSGMYLVRISGGSFSKTVKAVLLK